MLPPLLLQLCIGGIWEEDVASPHSPALPAWTLAQPCRLLGNRLHGHQHDKGVWSGDDGNRSAWSWCSVAGSLVPLQSERIEFWPTNHLEVSHNFFLPHLMVLFWRHYMSRSNFHFSQWGSLQSHRIIAIQSIPCNNIQYHFANGSFFNLSTTIPFNKALCKGKGRWSWQPDRFLSLWIGGSQEYIGGGCDDGGDECNDGYDGGDGDDDDSICAQSLHSGPSWTWKVKV